MRSDPLCRVGYARLVRRDKPLLDVYLRLAFLQRCPTRLAASLESSLGPVHHPCTRLW